MIQEVKYNGYSASPSDYECPDGDLADVINLIPEDGALKTISQPKAVMDYLEKDVLCEHKTSAFTHYIATDGSGGLFWLSPTEAQSAVHIHTFDSALIYQVTAIGNTLVALTPNGIFYFLWKADTQSYLYLGERFPECPISFGLIGEPRFYSKLKYENNTDENGKFEIKYDTIDYAYDNFSEDNKRTITSQALAKVNRFVDEVSTGDNRFMFPFFVRYGYRLYDGSLSHISAPILMLPCTYTNPYVICEFGTTSTKADIFAVAAKLDYQAILSAEELAGIKKWDDVIKSVDIFISAPIYTYDQSGECESFNGGRIGKFVGKYNTTSSRSDAATMREFYQSWDIEKLYGYETDAVGFLNWKLKLPEFSGAEIDKKIQECSSFFHLTSIELGDLSYDKREFVEFEDGILGSIVTREAMPDDYQSHDKLYATRAFSYNNRINLTGVQRKLFQGFDIASMVAYVNGYNSLEVGGSLAALEFNNAASLGSETLTTYVSVKTDQGTFSLKKNSSLPLSSKVDDIFYLYYPDASASGISIVYGGDGTTQDDQWYRMNAHSFLNGSSYFRGLRSSHTQTDIRSSYVDQSDIAIVSYKNKIYTSEVNNPFFFPVLGINTIGAGEVLGISTAAKALSQGQFGQFPLYAFTTEGVWALEVAANGAYIARQPITRDVCINPDSITQIDSAVLFATDRGVMLLSGSDTMCITDILDSEEAVSLYNFPKGEDLATMAFGAGSNPFNRVPFKTFLLECGMIYDYANQRIIVFNPNYGYAYVYSLESKQWGLTVSDIAHSVSSYPNALAMSHRWGSYGTLWDYSKVDESPSERCILITRPLKFGNHDILKTVDTIIQRGYFKKGHVQSVLYGSRDLMNWFVVASSTDHYLRGFRGTPYKYFRVAIVGDLEPQERLYGMTVQYEPRKINQPR